MPVPGLRLEVSDGRPVRSDLPATQRFLRDEFHAGLWPLDFSGEPDEIRALIRQKVLSDAQRERLLAHFLLPRERLLQILTEAGRQPHVAGGGALSTHVFTHNYSYPQLFVVQGNEDLSRFDRLHVNTADDGTPIDEFGQLLSGEGLVVRERRADGLEFTLTLNCPDEASGWLIAHDGGIPHIGSFSTAVAGSKCLVQAIGPPQWGIRYLGE